MNEAQTIAIEALKIPDAQFFSLEENIIAGVRDKLAPGPLGPPGSPSSEAPPILALGLPKSVDIDSHNQIPGLVAKRYTGLRAWEVDFQQNLTFMVTDLTTGDVKTIVSFAEDKRRGASPPPSRTPPEPDIVNRGATTYGVERFKVPDVYEGQWPSRIAVTATYYDWLSNTAVVSCESKSREEKPLAPRAASNFVTSVAVSDDAVVAPGFTWSVPETAGPGNPIQVRVILSVLPGQTPLLPGKEADQGYSLLVPVTLVLLKLDLLYPVRISMAIPLRQPPVKGGEARARFAVNLRDTPEGRALSGTYQVYITTGSIVSGPYSLTVSN